MPITTHCTCGQSIDGRCHSTIEGCEQLFLTYVDNHYKMEENNYPGSSYQNLFNYLHEEHGLTLLQDQMDDLISMVHKFYSAGAVWVKGAPTERKQYFAKVPSQIDDNLYHDAIIWPTQRAAHWYAAGNGFNFVVHDNEVIAYLAESATTANVLPTFWDVAKAFKWATEYKTEKGESLMLADGWCLIHEGGVTEELTPGNVAELYCLQNGFTKEKDESPTPAPDWAKEYDTLYYIVMPVLNKLRHRTDNDTRMMERGSEIRDTIHEALADIKKLPQPISSNEPPFLVQSDVTPAAAREEDWISVEDRPLIRRDGEFWELTEDGEKEFIAAVPYLDAATDEPKKERWWIRHCYIDGEGFLYVKCDLDTDESVAGWAVSDIIYWRPLPAPPKRKPSHP